MLLETVPNLSVGPDDPLLGDILTLLEEAESPGWALLDVHSDPDHNRTVLTMAGARAPLLEALNHLTDLLVRHGTLVAHAGVHPRIGLLDVLPFVALGSSTSAPDATRNVALAQANQLAQRDIPVYLYGALARRGETETLATIRKQVQPSTPSGTPSLMPDLGPTRLHPRLGATCVGVRGLLVAYNILLDTTRAEVGQRIARRIRGINGGLPGVQALAFSLASKRGRIQVSTNITNLAETAPSDVYEATRQEAEHAGVGVLHGELVGLAPKRCLPEDPQAMGLEHPPVSLEDHLHDAGLEASKRLQP